MKEDQDHERKTRDKTANDESYPKGADLKLDPSAGALLLDPEPPAPGSFTVLLPPNVTWGVKRKYKAIRLDFRLIEKTPVRREDVEGEEEG